MAKKTMTPAQFAKIRDQLGMTQEELALAMGMFDGSSIRRYESGRRAIPSTVALLMKYMLKFGEPQAVDLHP